MERVIALHEFPVDLEVDTAQVQRLLHLIPAPHRPAGVVVEAAVDGHPVREALGVHRHLPHLLGRRGDVDARLDLAHLPGKLVDSSAALADGSNRHGTPGRQCPARSSSASQSRRARSTAASKLCTRTPNRAVARSSRGSRSLPRLPISGSIRAGSSPAIAAAIRLITAVSRTGRSTRGRARRSASRMRSIIAAYVMTSGPAMSSDSAPATTGLVPAATR